MRHETIIRIDKGKRYEAFCLTCQASLGKGTFHEARQIAGDHQ